MLPVLAGMLLAIPISVFTSRPSPGRAARRHGLFCTPEEIEPPQEIRDVDDALPASPSKETAARGSSADRGLLRVVVDPYVNAVHRRHLRVRRRQSMEIRRFFEAKREALLRDGPGVLSPREKTALLCDAESVEWLHREIWRRADDELAPFWQQALRQPHALLDTA
jgi:membrane glycosyltransferase